MKKLLVLVTLGVITLFSGSFSSAEEKVVGLYPSPEGDYQKLRATEQFTYSGGNPGANKVLVSDESGNARWATLSISQPTTQTYNLDSVAVPGAPVLPSGTRYYNDNATSRKICESFGEPTVTGISGIHFDSPGDNYTRFWNGSKWETSGAKGMNSHIQSITCAGSGSISLD